MLQLTEKPAPRALRRPTALVLTAFVAGIVPFAFHAWAALHGSFSQDDFIMTYRAAVAGPFDLGFLFQDYHGHLSPGGFFVVAVLTWSAPLNFPLLVAPLLLMRAVATVLFWCLLVRCFGRRWAILVPFTVFTASTLLLVPTLWWAYGIQIVPVVLAAVGALYWHVRYLREGGRWWIGTFAWTLFGFAFYEKAVVVPVLLAGVTVLLGQSFRERWRYWAGHVALLVAFAATYLALTSSQVAAGGPPMTAGTVADLTGRMLGDTFLPGLAGGPWSGPGPGATWAPSPFAVVVVLVACSTCPRTSTSARSPAWPPRSPGTKTRSPSARPGSSPAGSCGLRSVRRPRTAPGRRKEPCWSPAVPAAWARRSPAGSPVAEPSGWC
ncbi:hypothetical protein AB0M71_44040 [Amycolatopsis sp. NPDC051114]|uniref:hypothetical protein n=1 Tax=Amycolatopsis sp. NPDC051114 TaxID=3155280 RepID=UPI0034395586